MNKILFIVAHRLGRSPGQRFRFEQYLDHLANNGFACDISWLLNENDDYYFYRKGHYFRKFLILLKTIRIRLRDLSRAKHYDIIFIYREAVMYGSTWFERQLRRKAKKMVLDYDDAIWLKDVSEANRNLGWMKRPSKTIEIIRLCDLIITGNEFLADFARRYHRNVVVIPTTIDTSTFKNFSAQKNDDAVCIGWTGSTTTLNHFNRAVPMLKKLLQKYNGKIRIRIIADRQWEHDELPVEFVKWNREREAEDLSHIDIGIMPLPDDEWARGKCGFKGLQYMALSIPAVLSPVGVNTEIVTDWQNGLLAGTDDEWIEKLSFLIENPAARRELGDAGRKTVEESFSFEAWKDRYLDLFVNLVSLSEL